MAKLFNKARLDAHNALVTDLNAALVDVDAAHAEYVKAIEALNDQLANAREFRDQVVGEIETYIEDKSERWQEGDTGSSWSSWKEEWEALDLDDCEVPDRLDAEDYITEFENASTEPST